MTEPLISVRHLSKYFTMDRDLLGRTTSVLKAVDDLSLDIYPGETFGLVGESGCGKTTVGKLLVDLYEPTAGEIIYQGTDLAKLRPAERRRYCRDIQLIFQDPYASLSPRMTVGDIIAEPIRVNRLQPPNKIADRVGYLLNAVGLSANYRNRFPHEFSGGQRQRVGIARALAMEPKLIVCDEPVSALDVSIQAQILELLARLREKRGLSYLFISHDLGVVRYFCQRAAVMYLGRIVESGPVAALFDAPLHPYTRMLRQASPVPDPVQARATVQVTGEVPSPLAPPPGCHFHPRCPLATAICRQERPAMRDAGGGRLVACHLYREEGKEGQASFS